MSKYLKLIPVALRSKLNKLIQNFLKNKRIKESNAIPKPVLSSKIINNTKILIDRIELLHLFPKDGIVAELGVDKGDFSDRIMEITIPKKLHLIDIWGSQRYSSSKLESVKVKFQSEIELNKIEIHRNFSTIAVTHFENNYFDWIYIDTDHSYEGTKKELNLYAPKVKEHGIIAGHDFIIGNWNGMVRYGVIEAVYEFCISNNWEIIYLTAELHPNPSFAIRKIIN